MFSVRILTIDSYQTNPISDLDPTFSEFRGNEIKRVPVIRIFGPTSTGEKTCLHIHGVFPYMYVPCTIKENINSFMHRLSSSIDNAINISSGKSACRTQHVYKIQLVRGIPIYGYHEREHLFFKIYFYTPSIIKKVADLLQNGSISNLKLQPHEAHIPFILQFMMDYNLYGMNFINIKSIKHRWNSLSTTKEETNQMNNLESYDSQKYLPMSVNRQTICALEVDAQANDILNRRAIGKVIELNPGLAEIWKQERTRRLQAGLEDVNSQLLYPKSPEKRIVLPTVNDNNQEQRILQRLQDILQEGENITLSNSTLETSYPLQAEEDDDSLNASCVVNHITPFSSQKINEKEQTKLDNLKDLSPYFSLETLSTENKSNNTSSLNEDDMNLVEMLADLSESDDVKKIIDDDSILGSQYLEQDNKVLSDCEDDENEQLNLTNLDLTKLSQNQPTKSIEKLQNSNEENMQTDCDNNLNTLTFPQFDGANDFVESPKSKKKRKRNTESDKISSSSKKCKKKKIEHAEQSYIDESNLEIASSSSALSTKNHPISTTIDTDKIISDELKKRSCTYNYHKSSIKQTVIDIELEEETDDFKTHNCDKLIQSKSMDNENLQKKMHKSKINKQGLLKKSPNSPRNYSPLNVIISSPKTLQSTNKNVINSKIPKQDCKILPRKLVFSESDDLKCNVTEPEVSQCNLNIKSLSKDHQQKKSDISYKSDKTTYSNFPTDLSFQINELNVSEGDTEENIHNVTFTQYIEEKIRNETPIFQSTYIVSKDNQTKKVPITIITKFNPPTRERVLQSLATCDISKRTRAEPFFSNKLDLMKQKEISSNTFNIPVITSFNSSLEGITGIKLWRRMKVNEFYPAGSNIKSNHMKKVLAGYNLLTIRTLMEPPQIKSVKAWLKSKNCPPIKNQLIDNNKTSTNGQSPSSSNSNSLKKNTLENTFNDTLTHKNKRESQYLGISHGQIEYSLHEKIGNASRENLQNSRILTMHQYITLLSVEVHIPTREDFLPNPQHDPIEAIFYAIHNDIPISSDVKQMEYGTIIIRSSGEQPINFINSHIPLIPTSIQYVESEVELLNNFVTLIHRCDPDILIGWEVEVSSWGYIFQRASRLGFKPFPLYISRTPNISSTYSFQMFSEDSEIKVPGRIFLNIWRIMRHEVALSSYTFESIMYNVMKERISCHNYKTLTNWWKNSNIAMKSRVIDYYVIRVSGNLRILSQLDIIGRTSEHARLFGIQFYEVFSRGSQFRVESMMLRLAKPLNFIPVSPSIQQRAKMRAPAALPLIMEPESKFYTDPLVVLDFQSLYPSIIIAYNYCFSTCLGRVEHLGQSIPFVFGATTLKINRNTLLKLQGKMNFAPNGVAFVKSEVRKGVLPRMLAEILNTRIMVKNSMKLHSFDNHNLQRMLHSQQLGLKLIANVTYGYTSANFSGRMPCIEIGDSVVSKGRETLERAIKIVESTPKWGAKVVYGDTDSLFILLPGKSRKEAFKIGADMADTVTAANPPPIKLKFEKILQPSILQTKKRYCGYMYETSDQKIPEYLAKGIETVRRDGCFAVSKILEKSLKILFDTSDISLLKKYLIRQFNKILCRRVSIEDLTFAKEFRGLDGYKTNAVVPALELTRRLIRKDPRAIPLTGERVRYVISAGAPNEALIHCVRTPWEVMCDPGLYPNSIYYITKVIIPPLNRCFNLFGIDVNNWYQEMSHRQSFDKLDYLNTKNQKSTICQFFNATVCNICGEQSTNEICSECMAQPDKTILTIYEKIRWFERTYQQFNEICYSCVGRRDDPDCTSLDCPVLYRMHEARKNLAQVSYLDNLINNGINNVNIHDKNVPSS
ncbi:DNA polymerase zeta catalytic subunit isoform X1 [Polistes fuscatus]|uniref:DNA polymerase zeta catalytic subunit isoform X1 n=1 Tax=Polistes fuscatus TaxID=30207 RepID=UPI001CA9CA43|nr:DNA polymerase zeta catalytic subunit isoform X1 [Polistes fuscatus]